MTAVSFSVWAGGSSGSLLIGVNDVGIVGQCGTAKLANGPTVRELAVRYCC